MVDDNVVPSYGIYRDNDDVAWLLQGRGGGNALGLKTRCPFRVQLQSRSVHCNHMIPLAAPIPNDYHWSTFMKIFTDPLVQVMLPIPKTDPGFYYLAESDQDLFLYLVSLSRLCSPIYPAVVPMWTLDQRKLMDEVSRSNVQIYVISGVEARHTNLVTQLASLVVQGPRKFLLVGAKDVVLPPMAQRITTSITNFEYADLASLPLENLGAGIVRRFMRREWPIDPQGSYQEGRHTRATRR